MTARHGQAAPRRRTVLSALAASAALAACGFELRRAPELRFRTLQLSGFAHRSPLEQELRDSINASTTTRVVDAGGEVVLEALAEARERSVVASTAAGQVREFQLRSRFNFRVRNAAGRELIPPTEFILSRDLSYSETVALAKQQEEAFLYRSMQSDIAAQVMRRLASLQTL